MDVTLPSLFEARVRADPAGIVLRSDEGSLNFAELNAWANRLAHLLIERGVGPERIVAVAMPRSVDAIVAFLAVLKAGGVYLPLDPTYPPDRIASMLADARPVLLLTTEQLGARHPDPPTAQRLYWSAAHVDGRPDTDPTDAERDLPLRAAHPIYLIYTSGSTGRPKGVLMPGSSMVNLVTWHAAHLPSEPGTRTAQLAAIGFDVSMHEILATLVLGKCLVVPTDETRRDPARLARWLADHQVRQVFLPTVLIEALCEAARVHGIALDSLTDVVQSGEPLTVRPETLDYLRGRPNLVLRNHYGSAEMQDVTVWSARAATEPIPSPAPIGVEISGTNAYVLDDHLRPVAAGSAGDLYVAGPGLARGYLRRPALTADRFLPDPFGPPGGRMYRTGDVVRRDADGRLVYVGRADNQVKVHGFRVELGEIEARLAARADITAAIVVPRELTDGHRQLVAYLLAADGARPEPERVRAGLAEELPAHMVPAAVVVLDGFPLAPSGKVDLSALPTPTFAGSDDAASTAAERVMVAAFAGVLGRPSVGVDDNFFALGGDSVSVLRLVLAAGRAGLHVTTDAVFTLGTPRALAARAATGPAARPAGGPLVWLGERQLRRLQVAAPDLVGIAPVSPLQQGFLFHSQGRRHDVYAEQLVLALAGPVDGAALRAAAAALLDRHAGLRSGFFVAGLAEPVRVTVARVPCPWAETDLSALALPGARDRADEVAERELAAPFDVERPPLLRLRLIRLGPDDHRLVVTYHHILLDGWSMTVLVRELLALYRAESLPPAPDPTEHPRWLRRQDVALAEQAWQAALGDVRSPAMLVDVGAGRTPVPPDRVVVELSVKDTARLEMLVRGLNVTLHTAVQSVWASVLGAESGRRDVVFGSTVSGRAPDIPSVADMVGLLINTVPVLVRLDGSAGDLLRRVQAEQTRLAPHQHLGLGRLQRLLRWTGEFDTLLVFENADLQLTTPADDRHQPRVADVRLTEYTHYPISVIATPGRRLRLSVSYQPDLFHRRHVTGLAERLATQLATIEPNQPLNAPR